MSRKPVLLLALAVTLLVAGCTGGDAEEPTNTTTIEMTPNDGLSVSLRSVSQTYGEGEPVVLELDVQNTGQRVANNIQKRLYGASFIVGVPPQFPGKPSLRGVDRPNNRSGEATTASWQISNPVNLDAGMTETFDAGARVNYNYRSTARGSLTVQGRQNDEVTRQQVQTETSAGPLQVEMDVESPVLVGSSDTGTQLSIPIRIVNVGDGRVADLEGNAQDVQILDATFENTGEATLSCPQSATLYDGTRRIICTAQLPTDVFQQQLTARIELGYNYFERVETTFAVRGLEGDQRQ